jgi:hypothetical protein
MRLLRPKPTRIESELSLVEVYELSAESVGFAAGLLLDPKHEASPTKTDQN